jgi:hypothetical protein
MPSTASRIDVYNMALDLLEETPVTSLTDGKPATNWLNRNYEISRDGELRKHSWNFALTRAGLAADSAAPAFGWSRQYTFPADCLAVKPLTAEGKQNGGLVAYEIEANKILTDAVAPLRLRYIRRVSSEAEFDPLFVEVLVAKLAFKMAHWLTGKRSFAERSLGIYQDTLSAARLADALESTFPDVIADDVIAIRSL